MRRKNAYLRIEIFLIMLLLILGINSMFYNFLSNYYMIAFLIIVLVIFKIFFGFEKDRHRYVKDIILNFVIYLLTFFILYYLSGLIITFARSGNYYTLSGFINYTLRLFCYIVLREYLRFQFLNKCDDSKIASLLVLLFFIFLDITNNLYFYSFSDKYTTFLFFALYVFPFVSNNILASFLSEKVGYLPCIFFMSIITLYPYVLPIIPNPSKYITSIVNVIFPIIVLYKSYVFFKTEEDDYIQRDYNKRKISMMFICLIVTVILVYFISGYFKYHALAVASGSMVPAIDKGDVVIVEKINDNYTSLEVGDVIAFKYSDTIIIHRIVNIVVDRGEYFFYTKGDSNKDADSFVIENDMIEGIVKMRIPYIGMPTVWLNEI